MPNTIKEDMTTICTKFRINESDLMAKLNKFFPGQPVASLSGDREFIGETWLHWLESQSIPFVLRLKENMFIWNESYVPVKLLAHAQHLQKRQKRILKGT